MRKLDRALLLRSPAAGRPHREDPRGAPGPARLPRVRVAVQPDEAVRSGDVRDVARRLRRGAGRQPFDPEGRGNARHPVAMSAGVADAGTIPPPTVITGATSGIGLAAAEALAR